MVSGAVSGVSGGEWGSAREGKRVWRRAKGVFARSRPVVRQGKALSPRARGRSERSPTVSRRVQRVALEARRVKARALPYDVTRSRAMSKSANANSNLSSRYSASGCFLWNKAEANVRVSICKSRRRAEKVVFRLEKVRRAGRKLSGKIPQLGVAALKTRFPRPKAPFRPENVPHRVQHVSIDRETLQDLSRKAGILFVQVPRDRVIVVRRPEIVRVDAGELELRFGNAQGSLVLVSLPVVGGS